MTNTIKTSEKKITIDNINGGAPIFIRIKGFCKDFGYTAYSFSQELNAFETALSVSIYSKGKNGNNTKQILADHNILMTDYVSFPPSNKDIRFEMKLANQNPANLVPGKITIKGSSRNYTTEFTQKAELSLFDLKAGKYDIKITWGGDSENQNPLSANLRMEIKPSFFQQLYVKVILVLMLLSVFYMGWSRYKIVSRKLIIYNEQQEHSDIQEKEWISKEELEEKAQLIKETVTTEKLYLDPKFNLKSLANKLDIPHYHVSRILKEYYHQNFNDFTNEFRVNEFVRIQKEEKSKNIKISTLSYQCGFYSESTFFRAFKKFMGKTPQQYQKELEKNQEG